MHTILMSIFVVSNDGNFDVATKTFPVESAPSVHDSVLLLHLTFMSSLRFLQLAAFRYNQVINGIEF